MFQNSGRRKPKSSSSSLLVQRIKPTTSDLTNNGDEALKKVEIRGHCEGSDLDKEEKESCAEQHTKVEVRVHCEGSDLDNEEKESCKEHHTKNADTNKVN